MSRQARLQSSSGIYHIILRGINRQDIFESDDDKEKFIDVLYAKKQSCGFEVYAWCLMDNHVHLVMKFPDTDEQPGLKALEIAMKKIGVAYVLYFNQKYERSGHLFQDRFRSEVVEDDRYLLTVVRYVHRNPVKAGVCNAPEGYRWSSYRQYLYDGGSRGNKNGLSITDTELLLAMGGIDEMVRFTNADNNDECIDVTGMFAGRLTDSQAREIMRDVCGCDNSAAFQAMDRSTRDKAIVEMLYRGINANQISRLIGFSRSVIDRCKGCKGDGSFCTF